MAPSPSPPASPPAPTLALPSALLLGSGACALVYQAAWLRELRLVFGASTAANAAVLAIFLGGLGLGALLLGPWLDRRPRPLADYGLLELWIALSAALSPAALDLVRAGWVQLGGSPALGPLPATSLRLLLAAAVLGPPTLLMGGTLPAMMRAVAAEGDAARARFGRLYAMNTLGSVLGALLPTFLLFEALGTRRSLWLFAGLNLLLALLAFVAGRRAPRLPPAPPPAPTPLAPPLLLLTALLSGLSFLGMELCWYRLLAPLLGGSSYSFGLILALALLGIGLGGLGYGALAARVPPSRSMLGRVCALLAAALGLPLLLGDHLAILAAEAQALAGPSLTGSLWSWTLVAGIAVLPAALLSGLQYPMLLGLLGRGTQAVGRQVGQVAAANTAGAILGSLLGGFVLLPQLGALWTVRLLVLLPGLLAAALLLGAATDRRARLELALALSLLLAVLSAPGPSAVGRHSPIGAGRSGLATLSGEERQEEMRRIRRSILTETDGVESALAVQKSTGLAFLVHGKVDGHVLADTATNLWLGLLPTLLHPSPRRALVIGLGTGQTASWAAAAPGIEQVEVIELEPALLPFARACAPTHARPLSDSRLVLRWGDAREWLTVRGAPYDIIISEPSNPYRAGIASLFSQEFYEAAAARLHEGGLFLQWIQAYELSEETLGVALATLGRVFPHQQLWEGVVGNDLLVVASRAPIRLDEAELRRRLSQEPWREGLRRTVGVDGGEDPLEDPLEALLASFVGSEALARAQGAGARVDRDHRPVIEYGFVRMLGSGRAVDVQRLRQEGRADLARAGVDGFLDPIRLEERRHQKAAWGPLPIAVPEGLDAAADARARARLLWAEGRLHEAGAAWSEQAEEPRGPFDALLVAEALAARGDEAARRWVGQLRPGEAALVQARLQEATGEDAAALRSLQEALRLAGQDPWIHPRALLRGLEVATRLGAALGPAATDALLAALEQPFSVHNVDEARMIVRLRLLSLHPTSPRCRAIVAELGPDAPGDERTRALLSRCPATSG